MTTANRPAPARNPQELEQFLIERQHAGDVEGMIALYETDAVLDSGDGRLWQGKAAIRSLFADLVGSGRKFQVGEQCSAAVCGDLALTATRFPDGRITAEVARRQSDGTWLWVIDKFTHA